MIGLKVTEFPPSIDLFSGVLGLLDLTPRLHCPYICAFSGKLGYTPLIQTIVIYLQFYRPYVQREACTSTTDRAI